jgi:hypothetical protein
MIHCHHCGTDNLDGSEFCDECGAKLAAASPARTPNYMPPQPAPPPPPSFTRDSVTPKPATPYTPPPPPVRQPGAGSLPQENSSQGRNQTVAFRSQTNSSHGGSSAGSEGAPGSYAEARAKLVIKRGGTVGKVFPLTGQESMIGRWDADGGIFPEVDLDQDDPEAKVSRRHARIVAQGSQFFIEDLGSTNGTFINRGPRLLPGNRLLLNDGDEIIVGKTFLKFVLN